MMFLKAIAIWLMFITAESVNGFLREAWLVPALGEVRAHQVSFISGSLLIVSITTLFISWLKATRVFQLLTVGFLWMLLTVTFEIGLGRLVLNYSWKRIAADYNLFQGGLMGIGLLLLVLVPLIAARLRRIQEQPIIPQ